MVRLPGISAPRHSSIVKLAEREGVRRPFEILVSMDADSRARIAAHLGVPIEHLERDPAREAWAILHRDLLGMQARGHVAYERLLPVRNITWREMLQRTAEWLRLPTDGSVEELERRIYEAFADRIVETWRPEELSLCDAMASTYPWVLRLRERLELSRNGVRFAVMTLPMRAWVETLGICSAVAHSEAVRGFVPRLRLRTHLALDRLVRLAPMLAPAVRGIAAVATFFSMLLVPNHARNAPVVVTLVLQSFQRAAGEPTAAWWHSL